MSSFDQPPVNPNKLRVVRTARSARAINAAAKKGLRPLVEEVRPGKDVGAWMSIYQHKTTHEIQILGDMRWPPGEEYELVLRREYYPHHFWAPFAAYLIPSDLAVGERVWLADLIEDIVAVWGNQGYNPRLKWAEATWTGAKFFVHFDPEKDAPQLVG
ncbi:MAG: hypothetical protein JSR82_05800 [Verrucomicrobia bacterium]|nr:hypothetical protein [Verrucomicrobiota bacterium]